VELIISPEAKAMSLKRREIQAGELNQEDVKYNENASALIQNESEIVYQNEDLSPSEKKQVEDLRRRDGEVHAHEQAHLSAAGELAVGGAKYSYQTGPDGRKYAVAGEVQLRMPDAKSPEEDLRIARQVEKAALAPAKPSTQDRAIASRARSKENAAIREINANINEKLSDFSEETNADVSDKVSKIGDGIENQTTVETSIHISENRVNKSYKNENYSFLRPDGFYNNEGEAIGINMRV
jgi:hypothetical protein